MKFNLNEKVIYRGKVWTVSKRECVGGNGFSGNFIFPELHYDLKKKTDENTYLHNLSIKESDLMSFNDIEKLNELIKNNQ